MIKGKVFIKYLFSYLAVLFIPIVLISIFIYSQFITQFKTEVINSTTGMLSQIRDSMDKHLESFASITSNISVNPQVTFLLSKDNVGESDIYPYILNAIKELNKYKNANSVIENIFLFINSENMVLSDTSKYDFYDFINKIYRYENIGAEEFKKVLGNINNETILPSQTVWQDSRKTQIISYIHPLPMRDPFPKAVLMMTIDETPIKRSMENALREYGGYVCVLDVNNNIIISNKIGDFLFEDNKRETLLSLLKEQKDSNYYITHDGFVISSVKSQKNDWKYISIIPSYRILYKVNRIRKMMIFILIITFAVGFMAVYYFSRKGYNDIKRVLKVIKDYEQYEQYGQKEKLEGFNNEWDIINHAIVKYISKNKTLQERIYEQIPMIKNSFFRRLLKGQLSDEKSVDEMLAFLELNNIKGYKFGVFIIEIDNHNVSNVSGSKEPILEFVHATITNVIEESIKPDSFIYTIEDEMYRINAIIGLDSGRDNNLYLLTMMQKIKESIKSKLGFTITIGVGGICHNMVDLYESYNEACKALEYKIVMGRDSVISYDTICRRLNKKISFSFKQEKELINFLRMGEYEKIQEILDDSINTIKREPVSIDVVKCIYFDIVNTAMKAAEELNIEDEIESLFLSKLNEMETVDEIYNAVSNFYKTLCKQIRGAKISKNIELRDKVIEYIDKNYNDSMLSVEKIADYFSVSPSYLSRFIKDHIGYSITDYIHEVRLQKAKELLKNSEKTVAEIAEEVGYNSLHNFSRVFKRYENITPTEYRASANL
ncbi:MAG: AraC family transcriptional regulator [Firmicutes bacterium]|nr:AraC family transcriptional regulator [Bacillota bacterium]